MGLQGFLGLPGSFSLPAGILPFLPLFLLFFIFPFWFTQLIATVVVLYYTRRDAGAAGLGRVYTN